MKRLFLFVPTALLAAVAATARAQQLTLRDAMATADRFAYANRIAGGRAATAVAQSLAPLRGVLPSARLEAGYVRTTDPIGAFGASLRQRDVLAATFDPQRLNYPAAIGNFQSGIVVEQPVFNVDAWAARRAAVRAADATGTMADWSRLATRVEVVRAYYGVALATERFSTLQAAARAAHAHVSQAEAMVRQGLVTKSDALLASVRAGDVDAQLADAEAGVTDAHRRLAVLLGRSADTDPPTAIPSTLPTVDRIRSIIANDTVVTAAAARADVRAAAIAVDAARADGVRARLTYAPRINAFARYDWNSPARLYEGGKNWTIGVMASWSILAGGSDLAEVRSATGRAAAAKAEADAAEANADLQVQETRNALIVALARLTIADRAAAQSAEAHRIVGRKYEGGLATVVELLDAQAVETQSALSLSQARWATIVADAERLLALGRDPAALAILDTSNSIAASAAPENQ